MIITFEHNDENKRNILHAIPPQSSIFFFLRFNLDINVNVVHLYYRKSAMYMRGEKQVALMGYFSRSISAQRENVPMLHAR